MCEKCEKVKQKLKDHIRNSDLGRVEEFMFKEYWKVIDNCQGED